MAGLQSDRAQPAPRLSHVLTALAADDTRSTITVGDLVAALQDRAFGALLLIFAFPNILPTPPGAAAVLGLPLLFLSAQMMLGRAPWLPQFIARRAMSQVTFATVFGRITPWLERAERLLRHRLAFLAAPLALRVIGALCLLLSMVLVLPIPLGNLAPAFAISIIALGVLERDGLWVIGGVIAATGAFAFVGGMAYAVVKSVIFLLANAF